LLGVLARLFVGLTLGSTGWRQPSVTATSAILQSGYLERIADSEVAYITGTTHLSMRPKAAMAVKSKFDAVVQRMA
jgi:hypothetical protein